MTSSPTDQLSNYVATNEQLFWKLFTFPAPTIACVNGHAIAGGMALLVACDYVISNGVGKMGMNEVKNGFILPFKLTEILRFRSSGRSSWQAIMEAQVGDMKFGYDLGYVHEIVSPEKLRERSIAKAEEITQLSMKAYAGMKLQLQRHVVDFVQSRPDTETQQSLRDYFTPSKL